MLFFLRLRPTIKCQGGSPVDPLLEPPADPPFDSTSKKLIFIVISASLINCGLCLIELRFGPHNWEIYILGIRDEGWGHSWDALGRMSLVRPLKKKRTPNKVL